MQNSEMMKYVDHTLLKAVSDWESIEILCEEAIDFGTASVCVPPAYVKRIKDKYGQKLKICTVIGFPLGYNSKEVKVFEAKRAIEDGADEIDMVINLTDVKNGYFNLVEEEIKEIKVAIGNKVLKVIIETCYLTKEEKIKLCHCVTAGQADYIKTSTGFGTGGATLEDVELFKKHIGDKVKIKAAGGIRSKEEMEQFIDAGAMRIGTSSAVKLLNEQKKNETPDYSRLIQEALHAREMSYAPYSGYKVGAALLTEEGKIYRGCNIESAAFSPTNCGERTAFFKAISEGHRNFKAIAVVGGHQDTPLDQLDLFSPCGVCRQVMIEFCRQDFTIVLAKSTTDFQVYTLKEILPLAFGPGDVPLSKV